MDAFVAELARATRFVDAAIVACAAARQLGAARTIVELACASGEPALLVDDAPDVAATAWWMVAPLVGPQGELGALRFASAVPLPREIERHLALVATHLSVWCARHGVDAAPLTGRDRLGPRQREIARLAARGLGNGAIAAAIGISINTVKARLKEVFHRLGVRNRTELAHAVLRGAPLDDVPPGVTRLATVTVTRVPATRRR